MPGGPKYCRFALCKENMDSGNALSLLARSVHCSPACFGIAGTKDKRAVTVQQVTAYKVPQSRTTSCLCTAVGLPTSICNPHLRPSVCLAPIFAGGAIATGLGKHAAARHARRRL